MSQAAKRSYRQAVICVQSFGEDKPLRCHHSLLPSFCCAFHIGESCRWPGESLIDDWIPICAQISLRCFSQASPTKAHTLSFPEPPAQTWVKRSISHCSRYSILLRKSICELRSLSVQLLNVDDDIISHSSRPGIEGAESATTWALTISRMPMKWPEGTRIDVTERSKSRIEDQRTKSE